MLQASALIEEIRSTGEKIISNDFLDMYCKEGVGSCTVMKQDGIEGEVILRQF